MSIAGDWHFKVFRVFHRFARGLWWARGEPSARTARSQFSLRLKLITWILYHETIASTRFSFFSGQRVNRWLSLWFLARLALTDTPDDDRRRICFRLMLNAMLSTYLVPTYLGTFWGIDLYCTRLRSKIDIIRKVPRLMCIVATVGSFIGGEWTWSRRLGGGSRVFEDFMENPNIWK